MADNSNRYIEDLLNLLGNPIHRRRRQTRVPGPDGDRIISESTDETGIGNSNETDNFILELEHLLDCNHPASNGLGGRCHYCDHLFCRYCIFLCFCCGLSLCPSHKTIANLDGQEKVYCRECATDIKRSQRSKRILKSIFSLFLSDE